VIVRVISLILILLFLLGAAGCSGANDGAQENAGDSAPANIDDSAQESPDCGGPTGNDQGSGAANNSVLNLTLNDLDGDPIDLSGFLGEIVVLNFWASWCPPCRQEMPELNELDKEFKESGAAVLITVNLTDGQRETMETARQFIDDGGYGFTVLIDDQGLLSRQFNISAIPQTFIIDRSGNISGSIIGSTTRSAILDEVNAAS